MSLAKIKRMAKDAFKLGNRASALASLKSKGWERLGTGGFATVMGHRDFPRYAIRVGICKRRLLAQGYHMDGFPEYARGIINGWIVSKLALKVYALEWDDWLSVAVVERCMKPERGYAKRLSVTSGQLKDRINGYGRYGHKFTNPRAVHFLQTVAQYGDLDVHAGNIMRRKNGQHVVTDPLTIPA